MRCIRLGFLCAALTLGAVPAFAQFTIGSGPADNPAPAPQQSPHPNWAKTKGGKNNPQPQKPQNPFKIHYGVKNRHGRAAWLKPGWKKPIQLKQPTHTWKPWRLLGLPW